MIFEIGNVEQVYLVDSKMVGFEGNIIFDVTRPVDVHHKLISAVRLEGLGRQYIISLVDGLTQCYQWFLANLNNSRK
jgi:GDP-L-fucose synthase